MIGTTFGYLIVSTLVAAVCVVIGLFWIMVILTIRDRINR